jgi:hypothetical protein
MYEGTIKTTVNKITSHVHFLKKLHENVLQKEKEKERMRERGVERKKRREEKGVVNHERYNSSGNLASNTG